MVALSLVDFLSLLLSPSTYFKIFYFCQNYHLKDTYKIVKKFHVGLKFEWGLWDQYWLSCERLPFEVFFSCLCDGRLRIAYANMLVTTQWPLERAADLTSLVWVCVLWLPESLMGLSALWLYLYHAGNDSVSSRRQSHCLNLWWFSSRRVCMRHWASMCTVITSMETSSYAQLSVDWNYLSMPKIILGMDK